MGLGKTIQSIAILAQVESEKTKQEILCRKSHHIVVVPKVTLGKWRQEIKEWFPSTRLFTFYGTKEEREQLVMDLRAGNFDILLTTNETVMREKHELLRLNYQFLILDEAQRIKNEESVLS
jgi:SWI/SNF-related matrix-associated actin-dependent regulator of chromatin subfamily A member 5